MCHAWWITACTRLFPLAAKTAVTSVRMAHVIRDRMGAI
jgi:hypothetical protein